MTELLRPSLRILLRGKVRMPQTMREAGASNLQIHLKQRAEQRDSGAGRILLDTVLSDDVRYDL